MWVMKGGDEKCCQPCGADRRWRKCYNDPVLRTRGEGKLFSFHIFSMRISFFLE
jgi:hypothetical protein